MIDLKSGLFSPQNGKYDSLAQHLREHPLDRCIYDVMSKDTAQALSV